jgi:hypothetical protein
MKIHRIISAAFVSALLALMVLAGCGPAGTSQALLEVTTPTTPASVTTSPAPSSTKPATIAPVQPQAVEIEFAQLNAEYSTDPSGTTARYQGKLLRVLDVKIEDMSEVHKPPSPEQFISSQEFRFRTDYLELMMPLKVGYTVDVEGTFAGPVLGYILISHCTFTITDDSFGYSRPDYQFTFS